MSFNYITVGIGLLGVIVIVIFLAVYFSRIKKTENDLFKFGLEEFFTVFKNKTLICDSLGLSGVADVYLYKSFIYIDGNKKLVLSKIKDYKLENVIPPIDDYCEITYIDMKEPNLEFIISSTNNSTNANKLIIKGSHFKYSHYLIINSVLQSE